MNTKKLSVNNRLKKLEEYVQIAYDSIKNIASDVNQLSNTSIFSDCILHNLIQILNKNEIIDKKTLFTKTNNDLRSMKLDQVILQASENDPKEQLYEKIIQVLDYYELDGADIAIPLLNKIKNIFDEYPNLYEKIHSHIAAKKGETTDIIDPTLDNVPTIQTSHKRN